jgi:hypothetical protein
VIPEIQVPKVHKAFKVLKGIPETLVLLDHRVSKDLRVTLETRALLVPQAQLGQQVPPDHKDPKV